MYNKWTGEELSYLDIKLYPLPSPSIHPEHYTSIRPILIIPTALQSILT